MSFQLSQVLGHLPCFFLFPFTWLCQKFFYLTGYISNLSSFQAGLDTFILGIYDLTHESFLGSSILPNTIVLDVYVKSQIKCGFWIDFPDYLTRGVHLFGRLDLSRPYASPASLSDVLW